MKKKLIEAILSEIKGLEMSVLAMKEKDAFSFSSLHDAFNKVHKLTQRLHDLEVVQVNAMKQETEKLLMILSEKYHTQVDEGELKSPNTEEKPVAADLSNQYGLFDDDDEENYDEALSNESTKSSSEIPDTHPLYPETKSDKNSDEEISKIVVSDALANANPPTPLDLKRSISLNDRYLFQRELFNNDRHAMNKTMLTLNAFETYHEVENYLKENTSWDFDNETVIDFFAAIKRGFV